LKNYNIYVEVLAMTKIKIMNWFIVPCVALVIVISSVASCSSDTDKTTKNDSVVTSENTEAVKNRPPVLIGEWEQINNKSEDMYQYALINEDNIEIYWISDNGETKSLYWAGSFLEPTTNDEPYVLNSKNDHEKTDSAMLASGNDEKTMTYKDETISYEASAFGVTTTVKLKRKK
jgi:hypothetical protein